MNFIEAVGSAFTNYVNFKSRSGRPEYWWFVLFQFLLGIVTVVVDSTLFDTAIDSIGPVNAVATLATICPAVAVSVRRLHDTGRSAWWLLLMFTVVGLIPLIYWACQPSDDGSNAYGSQP